MRSLKKVYEKMCNFAVQNKEQKMKKLVLLLAASVAFSGFAQKVVPFTNSTVGDTIDIQENQIIKITQTAAGSSVVYLNSQNDLTVAAVNERSADTANVAATVVITFAGSAGSVDSITINGVEIMGGSVAYTSNLSTTLGLVEDSIDNTVQSPVNYSATNTATTVTISAPAAFGDTANGYEVVVYTTTLTATIAGPDEMSGGFTVVRNIITLTDNIFNIEGGDRALNRERVQELLNQSGGGCIIKYNSRQEPQITTTDECFEVRDAINALD